MVRSLAVAVVGVAVAIDSAEGPIAAAGLREDTARLCTATVAAAAADCSLVAVAADSRGVPVGLGSLVEQPGAVTVRRDAEPEAPSPWPCPSRRACRN